MTSPQQWENLIGSTATDADEIGNVGQVYLDDETGQPAWVTVSTGLFGTRESFAPLYNAQPGQGEVRLAVTKQQVKDAPSVGGADEHLDPLGELSDSLDDALGRKVLLEHFRQVGVFDLRVLGVRLSQRAAQDCSSHGAALPEVATSTPSRPRFTSHANKQPRTGHHGRDPGSGPLPQSVTAGVAR